jgi:hypothetical protein
LPGDIFLVMTAFAMACSISLLCLFLAEELGLFAEFCLQQKRGFDEQGRESGLQRPEQQDRGD